MLTESHADTALSDGKPRAPRPDAKFAAYGVFGELWSSTPVERALCEDMLARMGTPLGVSVLDRDEGINQKIKVTVKVGYSYRNTDNLIALLMLRCSDEHPALPWEDRKDEKRKRDERKRADRERDRKRRKEKAAKGMVT